MSDAEDDIDIGAILDAEECEACLGTGTRPVFRDRLGHVDYLHGAPTDERIECTACGGTGHV